MVKYSRYQASPFSNYNIWENLIESVLNYYLCVIEAV